MRKQRFSKPTVSQKEYSDIVATAEASKLILYDPKFKFIREYLENAKKSIIDVFVNNRTKEVHETATMGNGQSQKTFITTRAEQENELSGQYKFIERLIADLEYNIRLPDDLLKQFEQNKIKIEHLNKKQNEQEVSI